MLSILKSLIVNKDNRLWVSYYSNYHSFFSGRDPFYDQAIKLLSEYYNEFTSIPSLDAISKVLVAEGEFELLKYIQGILLDNDVECIQDADLFFTGLKINKTELYISDIQNRVKSFENKLALSYPRNMESIQGITNSLLMDVHGIQEKVYLGQRDDRIILAGDQSVMDFYDFYQTIVDRKKEETLFFDLGLEGFEDIQIKRGDLVFFGAYTSHGKSIMLRHMSYRLAVEFGLNVFFSSHEMSAEVIESLFVLMHANNKHIFPGTPRISYTKFKNGALEEHEKEFLFDIALPDLFNSERYGTIYLYKPNKTGTTIDDILLEIKNVEATKLPLDAICIDYLALVLPHTKSNLDKEDFNAMMAKVKNFALSHTDNLGKTHPLIALSACQMSRDGLVECIRTGRWELRGIYMYSEIERSSDLLMVSLMTDEMKQNRQISLQNLKTRDGAVVSEPITYHIDFDYGPIISRIENTTQSDLLEAMESAGMII